jgi:putative ABC transport system permease protein
MTTISIRQDAPVRNVYEEAGEILTPLETEGAAGVNLGEVIRVALDSLAANKTRALLTMLGVIIGVASVVSLLSLGAGAQSAITGEIQNIGTNLIFVVPGSVNSGARMSSMTAAQNLSTEDVAAIENLGLPLNGIAPQFTGSASVVAPAADKLATISGTTPSYFEMQDMHTSSGSLFDVAQNRAGAAVAVLGADLAKDMFGSGEAVGQTVRIKDQTLRVVGVLASKGGGGAGSVDGELFAPINFVQQRLFGARTPDGNAYRVANIILSARNSEDITAIEDRITLLLRERHHLKLDGSGDDFTIMNQASFLSTLNRITSLLTTFLAAIAAISLLVGGIGIMNIMLVSVTERTREIGLRKAVGARGRDILLQFIVEAVVISLLGGLLGLAFGVLVAGLVTVTGIMTAVVSAGSVILALGFSTAVGLFFGIYPARRAAQLNPIDALRYE